MKFSFKKSLILFVTLLFLIFLSFVTYNKTAYAQTGTPTPSVSKTEPDAGWVAQIIGGPLIPEGCRSGRQPGPRPGDTNVKPTCDIKDVLELFANIASLILGIIGSVALGMFVYGGIVMLISAGNSEKINLAKTILRNAVIGIILVFTSWIIVNSVLAILTEGRTNFDQVPRIFGQDPNLGPPK